MRAVAIVSFAVLLAFVSASDVDCDFTAAVDLCSKNTNTTRCAHWKCLSTACPSDVAASITAEVCGAVDANDAWPPVPQRRSLLGKADGGDLMNAPKSHHKKEHKKTHAKSGPPEVDSPCQHVKAKWAVKEIHASLYKTSMDVYKERAHEHYTEAAGPRWQGIHDKVCPAHVPKTSDCSSTVTWIYWTLFGNGPDFLNGENWEAGYTGTLTAHGHNVGTDEKNLKIGDLCFYYHPIAHTAIYVGNGKVVSHGMDPVGLYQYTQCAPLQYCVRYI